MDHIVSDSALADNAEGSIELLFAPHLARQQGRRKRLSESDVRELFVLTHSPDWPRVPLMPRPLLLWPRPFLLRPRPFTMATPFFAMATLAVKNFLGK